jgi:hypothetical protein
MFPDVFSASWIAGCAVQMCTMLKHNYANKKSRVPVPTHTTSSVATNLFFKAVAARMADKTMSGTQGITIDDKLHQGGFNLVVEARMLRFQLRPTSVTPPSRGKDRALPARFGDSRNDKHRNSQY